MLDISPPGDPRINVGSIANLPDAIRNALLAVGRKRRFDKGQTIHIAGDLTANLSIILEGEVGFGRIDEEGRYIPASVLRAGESFGELPMFARIPRTHDATAMSTVVLTEISRARLDEVMDSEPSLRDHLLTNLALMLVRSLDLLDDERRLPIVKRVAKYLVGACSVQGGSETVRRNQAEVASDLGVSRSSVIAAIGELSQLGLVRQQYGGTSVPDIVKLRDWTIRNL